MRCDPESGLLACASIRLGRTKTEDSSGDDNHVIIIGRPVDALKTWLEAADITEGSVFRAIDQWGNLKARALSPQSVNAVLKARIERPASIQKISLCTACAPGSGPRQLNEAFPFRTPCSNHGIAPLPRPQAVTTRPAATVADQQESLNKPRHMAMSTVVEIWFVAALSKTASKCVRQLGLTTRKRRERQEED
ncbi:hypothetical protein FIV00_02790 [Labrenzia sp. THAF82]|nr:hypothetical protein FIV00_02790 [Labrenzia sp. THAF82]